MVNTRWKSLMFIASLVAVTLALPAFAQKKKGGTAEEEEMTFEAEDVSKTLVSKKMVRGEDFFKKAEKAMNDSSPQEQILVYFQSSTI
ncbi:MAG: hypothetical protein CVU72_07020, partial [Deltaproteobacteria bacterium HGW-Deltaproteobacteria-7]